MSALSLTPDERRRSLVAVITCMSLVGITIGLTFPLLSLILESRGYSRTTIGLNAAMPAVAMLLAAPFFPRVIGRLGLKPFLAGCIALEALLILLLKATDTIEAWFVIRFAMGLSTAGLFIAGETWINQIATEATRGRLMAVYTIVFNGGLAAGPLILTITGTGGWAPFVIGAACNAIGLLPLLWLGNLAPRMDGTATFGAWGFFRVAPTLAMAMLAFAVIESAAGALLPVYGVRTGYSEAGAATMLTVVLVGGIFLQWPIGWLADHWDRYRLIALLGGCSALGVAVLPWTVGVPWLLYGALFFWGGIASGIYTVALVIMGQRFRGADLVTANSAVGILWGFASMGGPAAAGVAMDVWDPHGFAGVLTIVCLSFLLTVLARRLWPSAA